MPLNKETKQNFCWLISANHIKFTEEYLMYMAKHILVIKMFINGLNMDLPQQGKPVHGVKIH